ncbi:MAG TPA: hypothetical protein VNC78_05340 [Actinomycetota bacterium]|nr:hypothetical protein [Actinomycetota bacterium]
MSQTELVDLESAIKDLPGVLGCVILTEESGVPSEVEAFVAAGTDQSATHASIMEAIKARNLHPTLRKVMVIELEAESFFNGRESLERAAALAEEQARSKGAVFAAEELSALAQDLMDLYPSDPESEGAEGGRAPVRQVILSSSTQTYEAEVALGEVIGRASGAKTAHGLLVVAQATLQAALDVAGRFDFEVVAASLESVMERELVVVLVRMADGLELVGAALVRDAPVAEAAVRATLDAINRRLITGR